MCFHNLKMVSYSDKLIIEKPFDNFFVITDEYINVKSLIIKYTNNVYIPYMPYLETIKIINSDITIPDGLPNLKVIICKNIKHIFINLDKYKDLLIFKSFHTQLLPINIENNPNGFNIQLLTKNNIHIIYLNKSFEKGDIDEIVKYHKINNVFSKVDEHTEKNMFSRMIKRAHKKKDC